MYYPIPKGSVVEVQGIKCQLPPVGYGANRITGELEYVGIAKSSLKKENQKWKRLTLPDNYEEMLEEEQHEQERRLKNNPKDPWTDDRLDKIRSEHWRYRLCGYWLMINGVPTYLTGTYWFYLNWCSSNTPSGYMDYREPDRLFFYALSHTDTSPVAGGVVYVGRRQAGKTYMANSWMLDRITLYKKKHGGIQSKTEPDAQKVFNKLVNCFVDLPEFFRPVYDQSQGLRPKEQLRLFKTNIKGKDAEKNKAGVELRSYIDFSNNKSEAYDGDESMFAYVLDEFGKKQQSNVKVTWETVRPCIDKEGRWFGKAFICSTIEDMENVGDAPRHLFFGSDINNLNANGRTKTGLYSIFFGAQYTTFFDEHGNSMVEKATQFHLNEMAAIKDPASLSSYKRKNPFRIEDAFRVESKDCHYNVGLLNDRLDNLYQDNLTTRGNFVWENGVQDSKVVFVKDRNGRWEICWNFKQDGESNKVSRKGTTFQPENKLKFVMGCDPFSHNKTVDNRRSDGAALVLMKFDATSEMDCTNMFVCKYKARPESASIFYEDMIKTAVYYGCQILFENNKNNWDIYFKQRGYESFLMKLDGYPDYGIPGNENTHRQLVEVTEEYINKNISNVYYKDLINDWLEFDMNNTTKFDLAMAAGYTLIADLRKIYRKQTTTLLPIDQYIRKHKMI
jgi:hypothetical protein